MDERSTEIQRQVGLLIKEHRAAHGISQDALASALKLSRASVANMEVGRQKIGVSLLYRIAEVLQTTPHKLLPAPDLLREKESEIPLLRNLPKEEKAWIQSLVNADTNAPRLRQRKKRS